MGLSTKAASATKPARATAGSAWWQSATYAEHVDSIRTLVASVRAAGSWKAHCRLPHKQVLRLRSLVARGRTRERLATTRAIRFIVRQGDNGIVWNILSFWRATD